MHGRSDRWTIETPNHSLCTSGGSRIPRRLPPPHSSAGRKETRGARLPPFHQAAASICQSVSAAPWCQCPKPVPRGISTLRPERCCAASARIWCRTPPPFREQKKKGLLLLAPEKARHIQRGKFSATKQRANPQEADGRNEQTPNRVPQSRPPTCFAGVIFFARRCTAAGAWRCLCSLHHPGRSWRRD